MTKRQQLWANAARQEADRGNEVAAVLFALIAHPNDHERQHRCAEHAIGFRRNGRRGFKCGIDGTIVKWLDPEEGA